MSELSVESLGLCLSEDHTKLTLSDETGEARTNKSLSVESLSLTRISAAYTGVYPSDIDNPPVLITLPLDEDDEKLDKVSDRPPNLLSVSHHNTSTSGVTPSATTLEGTLDDIPDFQEMLPLTSVVVVTKKEPEVNESKSPESSPIRDSNFNQSSSPQSVVQHSTLSRGTFLTSESKFMQEVKRHNITKPASSIKSIASTTAPKTSTSGITVVEVKTSARRIPRPNGKVTGSDLSKQTNPDHSIGSIKSDTTRDISGSISSTSLSSRPSEMTVFKSFTPAMPSSQQPFLLRMPTDEEMDLQDENIGHKKAHTRKVLGDIKALSNNKKAKPVKTWDAMERRSRAGSSCVKTQSSASESSPSQSTLSDHISRKRGKKHTVNYMDQNGIKQIVKEEMTAVVNMQNEIWHKILDSFVEKAMKNNENQSENYPVPRTLKPPPKELVMLQLPRDEPEKFYNPLKIPIVKSDGQTSEQIPMLLHFPSEDDYPTPKPRQSNNNEEKLNEHKDTEGSGLKALHLDVSSQTNESPVVTKEFVEVGIQPEEETDVQKRSDNEENRVPSKDIPKKHVMMKPPAENPDYQETVNKQEIPFKVMKECKMLLESIQNSANELKEMRKDMATSAPVRYEVPKKQEDAPTKETKQNTFIKTKHEIFLEKFFDNNSDKKQRNVNRFLDVVDLPQGTSSSGHFGTLRKPSINGKPSEFIHSTDIVDPKKTHRVEKRIKFDKPQKIERPHKAIKPLKSNKRQMKVKPDDGLRTSEVFKAKREIPRSPIPSSGSPKSHRSSASKAHSSSPLSPRRSPRLAPHSPGQITESTSQSLSSIGKYLSQKSEEDNISLSDKTIENEDQPMSEEALSPFLCAEETPEIFVDVKHHSTPTKQKTPKTQSPSRSEVASKVSSESYQPKAIDPNQFSQYIANNLSKIKQAYSESHQKELDRTKKVNMLLQCRHTSTPSVAKPTPLTPSPRLPLSETQTLVKPTPLTPSPRLPLSETQTLVKPPELVIAHRPVHQVVEPPARPCSTASVSVISSDTSLPTNTDELLKAALDSDSTLPPQPRSSKQAAGGTSKQTKQKKTTPLNHNKRELEKWKEEKHRARMLEFRKEREEKIRQESRPFQRQKTQPTPPRNEFDRKAAVLRRLNMAEALFNDIQKTPKPVVSQSGTVKDRTTEWVQGLNIEEFDSIHSQTFTSEHGASDITAGISLP